MQLLGTSLIDVCYVTLYTPADNSTSIKTVVMKGKAPVDSSCALKTSCHVYTEDDDIYDVMLNQTNIEFNNNKYYVIQLLEDDNVKHYHVWTRWGRGKLNYLL